MVYRGDHYYARAKLNAWFMVSSLLLLAAVVWMVLDDYNRPWKRYQRAFRGLEVTRARETLATLETEETLATEAELVRAVEAARTALAARGEILAAAEEALRLERAEHWRLDQAARSASARYNSDRYRIEQARRERGDPAYLAGELGASETAMTAASAALASAAAGLSEAEQRIEALRAEVTAAEAVHGRETRTLTRARERLERLAPTDPARRLADVVRDDVPGLDFIAPTIAVRKIEPPELSFELNFTRKGRIDMCTTCHLGIENPAYRDAPQPFTTHPRPDLYLSASSPHPTAAFGCTICHRGAGEALDFVRCDHRPDTAAQEQEWRRRHGWHKQEYWDDPMLPASFVEAGCLQCHKDSLELIADAAPQLAEGYRLYEQYGCYACHQVDWFPEARRPGPPLVNLQAKLRPGLIASWVARPRNFRPTTRMPQLLHLENFARDVAVARTAATEGDRGRDILGQEWNDTAVAAIEAFLLDRAPRAALPLERPAGDAYRGREVMRLTGCFACHNTAPYGGEVPRTIDPTLVAGAFNGQGPNLRGVMRKVGADWLYNWVRDPAAWYAETRMPDLRLSARDAADLAAFMAEDPDGIFGAVPAGWEAQPNPVATEVLAEQARWFFPGLGRFLLERRLRGEDPEHRWDDPAALAIAVGEKLARHYGCFSCHAIEGLEDLTPVGTEHSTWGSRRVDRHDFGLAHKMDLDGLERLDPDYREGWLLRKISRPRSFDLARIKSPTEKLRMGWFELPPEEVRALGTFILGLVEDEVRQAAMSPGHEAGILDRGWQALRQYNCRSCHTLEHGRVTFRDAAGELHTVAGDLLPFEDEVFPPRMEDLEALRARAAAAGEAELGVRLLRLEPDFGLAGQKIFVPLEDLVAVLPPDGGDFGEVVADYYLFGGVELFDNATPDPDDAYYRVSADPQGEGAVEDVDGIFRRYWEEPYDKVRWTFLPPGLWDAGRKLRGEWLFTFLNEVTTVLPPRRARMPSFRFREGEARAITDALALASARQWPQRYARALRAGEGKSVSALAETIGIEPGGLRAIEDWTGSALDFDRVLAHGARVGFRFPPAVGLDYEPVRRRSGAYLAERAARLGEPPEAVGERLAVDAVNCFQCHLRLGAPPPDTPAAWGSELADVGDRLREDWVQTLVEDPQRLMPGTSMPTNFAVTPAQYQDLYPGSTNEEQIQVVLDWLFNFRRYYLEQRE